jgi:hypothetical protein
MRFPVADEKAKAALQKSFEMGLLVKWIEMEAVSSVPYERDATRDALRNYCDRLGLDNIGVLLDVDCPYIYPTTRISALRARPEANAS